MSEWCGNGSSHEAHGYLAGEGERSEHCEGIAAGVVELGSRRSQPAGVKSSEYDEGQGPERPDAFDYMVPAPTMADGHAAMERVLAVRVLAQAMHDLAHPGDRRKAGSIYQDMARRVAVELEQAGAELYEWLADRERGRK